MRFFYCLYFLLLSVVSQSQIVNVSTSTQLTNALAAAAPGQTIVLADGVYNSASGNFSPPIGVHGTPTQPITIRGGRNAVLTIADSAHGYGFWLRGNNYWVIKGFTTRYCKNGVMIDSSKYVTVDSVQSVKNGQSGIHLRTYSSFCTVQNCYIDSCGILDAATGEGIYIGTAYGNWCEVTNCNIDTCNYNTIQYNTFGKHIAAENIDIKEGTKYGLIRGNILNGTGLANQNGGDSWIDVKGNYYTIELNTGTKSFEDGIQTHIQQPGWGNYNTFNKNTLNLNGGTGRGIFISTSSSTNGTALNNKVCNNNTVSGAAQGLTNVTTQTCTAPIALANELLLWNVTTQNSNLVFDWQIAAINNLQYFIVEQSTNGKDFYHLFKENINELLYKKLLKEKEVAGQYFRLALYEKDGKKTYSSIIRLNATTQSYQLMQQAKQLVVYNAFNQSQLQLFDIKGRLLKTAQVYKGTNYINLSTIAQGVYFVTINGNADKQKPFSQKIFIP